MIRSHHTQTCEPCGFYSAENTPTACPTCGGLKFTLLPPLGQAGAPLVGVETVPTATARPGQEPRAKRP